MVIENPHIDSEDQFEIDIYNSDMQENVLYDHHEVLVEVQDVLETNATVTLPLTYHSVESMDNLADQITPNDINQTEIYKKVPKKPRSSNSVKRKSGTEYRTKKGILIPEKGMKSNPCENRASCYNDCASIPSGIRQRLFNYYWNIPTQAGKDKYLSNCIDKKAINRKRIKDSTKRKCTQFYSVTCPVGNIKKSVCKQFLMSTLDITAARVRTVANNFKNVDVILKPPKNTRSYRSILQSEQLHLDQFISSLPAVPSHYCRSSSTKKYLPTEIGTIANLHRLYKQKQTELGLSFIGYEVFRTVLKKNYNIGIHKPKKDKCEKCESYRNTLHKTAELDDKYVDHIKLKDELKKEFLNEQSEAKADPSLLVCSFDLQKVLNVPKGNSMLLGYYRKFAVYNFTVYESATRNGHCYLWNENQGKRGANEICSNLFKFLNLIDNRQTVIKISLYCDNCAGQNKNRFTIGMIKHFISMAKHIKEITLTFLITGHTYMPVDSMHAVIENHLKNQTVWSYNEYPTLLRNSRRNPKPFDVENMKFNDFYDWISIVAKNSKIKCIHKPYKEIKLKHIKKIKICKSKIVVDTYTESGVDVEMKTKPDFPRIAYNSELPINIKKYNDLNTMCSKHIIPEMYHNDFKVLQTNASIRDVLNETDEDETEGELDN